MTRPKKGPPRLLESALEALAPPDGRSELVEDLRELFALRCETNGRRAALLWYGRQILSFAWRFRFERSVGRRRRHRSAILASFFRDVAYAGRNFRRSPGLTVAILVTLSLGIGANVSIWSVLHHVVLRPLGHPKESRLVQLWPEHRFTREEYDQYRTRIQSCEGVTAFVRTSFTLTGGTAPEVLRGVLVSPEHFGVFGRTPLRGRDFTWEDTLPGAAPVAIVSYETWQHRLGAKENVLGTSIELGGFEGASRTIVGIAPPSFQPFAEAADVWAPLEFDPNDDSYRHVANLGVVGRLRPGVSPETMRAELASIAASLEPAPSYLDKVGGYRVAPLRSVLVERVAPTLLVLLGAVGVVLLLCCFNVANLLLARSANREREVRVRLALGASRFRIARQVATEHFVLAAVGGLSGLALAWLGSSLFAKLVPPGVPRAEAIPVDVPVALFALALSLAASVVFGLAPVVRLAGVATLHAHGARTSRERSRLNRALITTEIALSLVLVVASGLLVKSFWKLQRVDAGIRSNGLLTLQLLPSTLRYPEEADLERYYDEVLDAVRGVPGVVSAGAIQLLPMTPQFMGVQFSPTGAPVPPEVDPPSTSYRIVTPDYRRTLGIPLIRGRDLTESDRRDTEKVGMVNETFAREVWPKEDPLGRQVHWDDGELWFTVVGVVGDVHQHQLDLPPRKEVYVPHAQDSWPNVMSLVVRTATDPEPAAPAIREAVWSVDSDVPIRDVRTMDTVMRRSMSAPRIRTVLFSGFAVLAFVLSAVGVYGVVSYTVSRRTKDIGIRMALGATRRRVLKETLSTGMRPVGAGVLLGLLLSLAAGRLLDSFLFRVEATDPAVLFVVGASLLAVAMAAAYLPARRASSVDPVSSLNVEG